MSAVSRDELKKIEKLVNGYILSGAEIKTDVMSLDEAKKSGATALFGEKYGTTVRVVKMGEFSSELCGGTHLLNTSMAGSFRILSEASVASGVRRIEAVTGLKAVSIADENAEILAAASSLFKAAPTELTNRIESQFAEIKELKRVIEQYKAKESSGNAGSILEKAKDINGLHVAVSKMSGVDANALRTMGDVLRDKDESVVALLASVNGEKISYLCVCGSTAVERGIKAGDVIRYVTAITGGKGGGKADSAMGGGSDLAKLDDSLSALETFVKERT
jgi:alanyl-tRNA synthetase